MTPLVLDLPRWSRSRFLAGANRYIQQESTFWRRSLWEKAGSRTESSCRHGADFELWVRFFRHAKLYPVDAFIGGFRVHGDSLGLTNLEEIHRTHDGFIEEDLKTAPWGKSLKVFRRVSRTMQSIHKVRGLWQRLVINNLSGLPGPDLPPIIKYQGDRWKILR